MTEFHAPIVCAGRAVSCRHPEASFRRRSGTALVIVLALLVLMLGVVLAFFSQSMLQRQVSQSSASQTSVDLFARGAVNTTIGDLIQEITAGSTAWTTNVGGTAVTIYRPSAAGSRIF
jgi:uncharacterized membrane protein